MPVEFTKCAQCGIIFPNPDGQRQLCPRCGNEPVAHDETMHEVLRRLKNILRDMYASAQFLTMQQLAEKADTDEGRIWHFIQIGEIDTASINDPEVRSYLARRHKERLKAAQQRATDPRSAGNADEAAKGSGFHIRHGDERPK